MFPALEGSSILTYSVAPSARHLFSVSPNGSLYALAPLDREASDSHAFVVTASDEGGLASECLVRISVLDENDNPPRIVFPASGASVPENSPVNTPVVKLSAVDRDEGRNAEVDFFLAEEDANSARFSLGRVDGILRTRMAFDREEEDEFVVRVRAVDHGAPRLSSEVEVKVKVVDENDNAPVFTLRQHA